MTGRELLQAAANAAGIVLVPYTWGKGTGWDHEGFTVAGKGGDEWNPLEDDGEAMRLAVELLIQTQHDDPAAVYAGWTRYQKAAVTLDGLGPWGIKEWLIDHGGDRLEATRYAIVKCAAAIRCAA